MNARLDFCYEDKIQYRTSAGTTMSMKLFFVKAAKPVGAAAATYATYWAVQEWEKAGVALEISDNKQHMETLFDRIDVDQTGKINSRELKTALKDAGMNVGEIRLKAMMYAVDQNSDGKIDREEWRTLVDKIMDDRTPEHFNEAADKVSASLQRRKTEKIHRYDESK